MAAMATRESGNYPQQFPQLGSNAEGDAKMNTRNQILPAVCVAMLLSVVPGNEPRAQSESGQLEEVIVTARRIEERLQDTPISITAFTAEKLRDRMIVSTDELDQITPNLQFTNDTTLAGNNNSSNIFIRGVGQVDPTSTVDPGVGLYLDDVYMGQSVGGTMTLRDIDTVQILRGPQGTLFGRNSVGGAVLLTTVEPGDEFGGTIRAGVGSDSLADLFIAFDAPFSDTVRAKGPAGGPANLSNPWIHVV